MRSTRSGTTRLVDSSSARPSKEWGLQRQASYVYLLHRATLRRSRRSARRADRTHGHDVDLYDELSQPIRAASYYNEGKVHLGLLYAKDPSLRTARLMLDGLVSVWQPSEK